MNYKEFVSRILLMGWTPVGAGIFKLNNQRALIDDEGVVIYSSPVIKGKDNIYIHSDINDFDRALEEIIKRE